MDKAYDPKLVEEKIYALWEKGGYFTPQKTPGKSPFVILLPLPNANDPMHMGHAMFTVQDILIRYHRMLGDPTLWLPGGDHAGIETQYVFEKKLTKEDKSRFDFDRQTLYQMIEKFVEENKDINKNQMKRLGFSLDWTRYHYSLEPEIIAIVLDTFKQMYKDGLVYRAERLVNYCTKCGTAFSDLEVNHEEKQDLLYYLDYGSIQIATARPETIFADVAVAVNPSDKRYQNLIGKTAMVPLINKSIPIIADAAIKTDFGTGALKVTPAHNEVDWEIGRRHHLPSIVCVDRFGRLTNVPKEYAGLKVNPARLKVVESLGDKLIKTEPLTHTVSVCYRCKSIIEPLPMPQWFIKTKTLAQKAIQAVKTGKTKIVPLKRFEKMYFDWLENIRDWNISRQIVWGPRMPVWYNIDENPNVEVTFIDQHGNRQTGKATDFEFAQIEKGLQQLIAPEPSKYVISEHKPGERYLPDTDTFDTWFLSGQWPFTTLGFPDGGDFKYFYPTSVLDTMWDILFFWVARMMMMGLYRTGEVPFKVIHLHSRVVDNHGQKMSKSKGNVTDPMAMVEKYGADALRFALVFGAAPGSDIAISEDKIRGMRNFVNKLWNIGRLASLSFANVSQESIPWYAENLKGLQNNDQKIIQDLNLLIKSVTKNLNRYRFSDAAQDLYEFTWHTLADKYLEENKERYKNADLIALSVLRHILLNLFKLLHPFIPFATETLYQKIPGWDQKPLIISVWPKTS